MLNSRFITFLVAFLVLVFIASQSFFILREQQSALVIRLGSVVNKPSEPGLYFRAPFVDTVRTYDARQRNLDPAPIRVQLVDGSPVIVDYYVLYRVSDVEQFFVTFGNFNAAEDRLQTISTTAVSALLGQATLEEDILSDNRLDLTRRVAERVSDRTQGQGLEIEDLRISKVDLPLDITEQIVEQMNAAFEATAERRIGAGREAAAIITGNTSRQVAVISQQAEATRQRLEGEGDALRASIIDTAYAVDIDFFLFQERLNTFRTVYRDDFRVLSDNGWLTQLFRDLVGEVSNRSPNPNAPTITLDEVFPGAAELRVDAERLLADDAGASLNLDEIAPIDGELTPVEEVAPNSTVAPLDEGVSSSGS